VDKHPQIATGLAGQGFQPISWICSDNSHLSSKYTTEFKNSTSQT